MLERHYHHLLVGSVASASKRMDKFADAGLGVEGVTASAANGVENDESPAISGAFS
jgi:hypothetical protein